MHLTLDQVTYMGCAFEAIMALILLAISFYSYSVFKITREKNYKWFSASFMLMAISFIGRVIMEFVIYTAPLRSKVSDVVVLTLKYNSASDILWHYGLFSYRTLMLLGLMGIFIILTKSKEKKNWILLGYLAILTSVVSMQLLYVFDLTAAVILLLIFAQFAKNYMRRPSKRSLGVALAFLIIFFSHISFIFMTFDYSLFVAGKIIQLLGYLTLLAVYVGILLRR
jgi:hypothetical protein